MKLKKKRKEIDVNDQCLPFTYDLKSAHKYVNDESSLNELESMLKNAKLIGMGVYYCILILLRYYSLTVGHFFI